MDSHAERGAKIRIFDNKVLRKILGIRDMKLRENGGSYIMLSNMLNIIRNLKTKRLRWAGHVARMEQSRNTYRVLVGNPEG